MDGRTRLRAAASEATTSDEPVVIVSCDSHIGPRLEQMRPFCPRRSLDDYDAFTARAERAWAELTAAFEGRADARFTRNHRTAGHYDGTARRADMDRDGIAAELIFHGSQNGQPMPFGAFTDVGAAQAPAAPRELAAIGLEIYDRWLAAFVAEAPERHVGVAHVPIWDVEAAVAAVRTAHRDGLRAVNFPAPRPELTPYNDRCWEPFWEVCEELRMPLCTHAGSGGEAARYRGPEAEALQALEHGGWFARRAMHWMVLGGVFERHPGLLLFLVEQPGTWWTAAMAELDSVYRMQEDVLRRQLPSLPSTYCHRNVRIGGSFLAAFEAERALADGYADILMWGSDYPHMEGTFQHEPEPAGESIGRQALRRTFSDVPEAAARAMLGGNAVRDLGLDGAALGRVAAEIGAPTAAELAVPLAAVPAGAGLLAFRRFGPWA